MPYLLFVQLKNGKRSLWGTYKTLEQAHRRGLQLLSNPFVADWKIRCGKAVWKMPRPEPRKVLPEEPVYAG